ncbi:unnamed protein product, partial [Medioppia subpectinata]
LSSGKLLAHQILVECRQHLSAPVVLDNQLSADMTDKTLSIFREMLTKHNTLYDVCKHVVDYMDLEYGSSWHCLVDYDEYNGCLMIDNNFLVKVKFTPVTFTLFHTMRFYWSNFKARLEHNKITRKLDIEYTAMNESMVSFVTNIVFEAIDSNDNISATIHYIVTQMKARYPVREWQCFVYYREWPDEVKYKYLNEHAVNYGYKVAHCLRCHETHTPGADCIELFREVIEPIMVDNDTQSDHGTNDGDDHTLSCKTVPKKQMPVECNNDYDNNDDCCANTSSLPQINLSEEQILAECRRQLSAPELFNNQMSADMTDKTLAIIREMLIKYKTVYDVCENVVDCMELEFGTCGTRLATDGQP